MKRLIIALGLCFIMIAVMAVPAMAAAPKTLTFTTGLTDNLLPVEGTLAGGFRIIVGTIPPSGLHDLTMVNPIATPALKDGMYAFYLKSTGPEKAALMSYFADPLKGWPPEYLAQMHSEVVGGSPFFYLKADAGKYSLVDGFAYELSGGLVYNTLRIDDDYPVGTYIYKGHLKGSNNVLLQVTVTLNVVDTP